MPMRCLFVAACLFAATPAFAQVTDAFDDGDFTGDPAWTGTTDRWTVAPLDGSLALRSQGRASADTIFLATPSAVSHGAWSFTFAHRGVNLSTFNGARVFLAADGPSLRGPVLGYYLQLGGHNADEVRLYRQDGDPRVAAHRVLLGRSAAGLLAGDANRITLTVLRTQAAGWTVSANGHDLFTASDSTYLSSRFFGVWLKHTQAAAAAFFFDDFSVAGDAHPGDTTPPALERAEALDGERVRVTFDEPVDGCYAPRYEVSDGIGTPGSIEACEANGQSDYVLRLNRPLVNGRTYTLLVRGVADLAGNVLVEGRATFAYIRADPAAPAPREVVINEILYAPSEPDLEFVELFSRSERPLDLSRFRFSDERLQPVVISEAPAVLQARGYAVLVRDPEAFQRAFPGVPFIAPPSWPALNNSGDGVVLSFDDAVIDAVFFDRSWGGDGVSLERKDPDGPSDSRFNFAASVAEAGATPGARNSRFAPDRSPPLPIYAEQASPVDVDVFFDEPIAPASVRTDAFTLEDGRIPRRVFVDEEGSSLRLRFDAAPTGSRLQVDGLRDLTGNTLAEATVVLAFLAEPGDLIVNEILYEPLADDFDARPNQPEYIELLNRSDRPLTLRHHYWTDVPDEEQRADTLCVEPGFAGVAPRGFAVLFAAPNASADPPAAALIQSFPEASDTDALLIPVARATLGLRNDGDLIHLHRRDGVTLDSVRYDPSWHHPNLLDATGVALQRIAPEGDANDGANWTSSVDPTGGTPGRPNGIFIDTAIPPPAGEVHIEPSPFSPDRDGRDDVTAIRYTLATEAALIRVRVYDARGRLVRTLREAALAGRSGRLLWDGLDEDGHALHLGIYVVLFEAFDAEGGATYAAKRPVVLARPMDG